MAAALARAQALSVKHAIDLAIFTPEFLEGRTQPAKEPIVNLKVKVAAGLNRRPPSDKFLRWLLQAHFDVEVLMAGSTICIVGRHSAAHYEEFAYKFLNGAFNRIWVEYKRKHNAASYVRNSVFYGIYEGLNTKLSDNRKEVTTSVLRKHIDEDDRREVADLQAMEKKVELMVIEEADERKQAVKGYHPTVRYRSMSAGPVYSGDGRAFGREKGEKLEINRPLNHKITKEVQ